MHEKANFKMLNLHERANIEDFAPCILPTDKKAIPSFHSPLFCLNIEPIKSWKSAKNERNLGGKMQYLNSFRLEKCNTLESYTKYVFLRKISRTSMGP